MKLQKDSFCHTVTFGAKRLKPSPEGRVWEGVTWTWVQVQSAVGRWSSERSDMGVLEGAEPLQSRPKVI